MAVKVLTAAVIGLDAAIVEVEADLHRQLPAISIVGLPDKAVEESKERVKSAIKNCGIDLPRKKITINLAPADIKKEGPAYDLPIAVSILLAMEKIHFSEPYDRQMFIGELALDGGLRPVQGVIAIVQKAKEIGIRKVYLPRVNAQEASLVRGGEIIALSSLRDLIDYLHQRIIIAPYVSQVSDDYQGDIQQKEYIDIASIRGQESAKRALEIAAAGGHNLLLSGPPGTGKTLLARALPTLLPPMTHEESLEVTKIYSVVGAFTQGGYLMKDRPFRSPHHTASGVSLVGGGSFPRPGEITLAHRGVLFLDELPEFPRSVLENLRQPLEDGIVTIARAGGTLQFPAKFLLVAAMNPCPCGYLNDPVHPCTCTPTQILKYQKKISGPLLDRIDLHVEVPRLSFEELTANDSGETSDTVRRRVQMAREKQKERFQDLSIFTNAEMTPQHLKSFCKIDYDTLTFLKNAVNQLHLSTRAYHRILKIARTIADLSSSPMISLQHAAEALQYRPKVQGI